jgi:hypothetical protein
VVVWLLHAELRRVEPEVSSGISSPSMKNKLEVAPGLQDLDGSDVVLAAMGAEGAVRLEIYVDLIGSGASGEDRSPASSSTTRELLLGDEAPGSASSVALLPSTLQAEGRSLPPWLLVLKAQLKVTKNLFYGGSSAPP